MSHQDQRVFVAGHRGMVGAALVRELQGRGYRQVITRSHSELDLENQNQVHRFFSTTPVDVVYLAAAKVGGILANQNHPVDFLYRNLMIQNNVINQAHAVGVERLLFLGSSCIYPRGAAQPMREDALLTGPLEPTNEPYAIAKIAGIKLCESHNRQYGVDYRSVMPANLFGPGDNFHPENSHVLPALLRRFDDAARAGEKEVVVWGSGTPRREFLYIDDMAEASLFVMDLPKTVYEANTQPMLSHINVGTGEDISIAELAEAVARITGFSGRIAYDNSRPDGTMRKLMDVSRLAAMGWKAQTPFDDALQATYRWYLDNEDSRRT